MGSPDPSGALTCHRAHLHALAIRITLNPFAPCFTKFLIFLFSSFSILCLKMSSSLQLHKKYSAYAILHSVGMRKKTDLFRGSRLFQTNFGISFKNVQTVSMYFEEDRMHMQIFNIQTPKRTVPGYLLNFFCQRNAKRQ